MKLSHQQRGRKSRRDGASAEAIVASRLRSLGLACVERIETGFRVKRSGKKIIGAIPIGKVSGDFHAIAPGGKMVIVECKYRPNVLQWSALEAHQVAALNVYHYHNALSLLAWVHSSGLSVMQWPLPTNVFSPGLSLTQQAAASLNIQTITERK